MAIRTPTSCCGVLNLRQGSFAIGLILLTMHSLSLLGCIVTWVVLSTSYDPADQVSTRDIPQPDGSVITITTRTSSVTYLLPLIFGTALLMQLVHVLFSGLLLAGVQRERPCLLLTWLVYQIVTLVLGLLGAVATFILALRMSEYALLGAVAGTLVGLALMSYCFVVVLAYYQELRRGPPPTVVVRQPDMVKMVDIA